MNLSPLIAASVAAIFAFLGWRLTLSEYLVGDSESLARRRRNAKSATGSTRDTTYAAEERTVRRGDRSRRTRDRSDLTRQLANMVIVFISTYFVARTLTRSSEISAALAIVSTALPQMLARRKAHQIQRQQERAWPEAIDSIIAALHAGQSISEAIASLTQYGPMNLRYLFEEINARLSNGASLTAALESSVRDVESPSANQLFVTLIQAKEYGGREVTSTLRLLANFLRDQGAAVEEIETRFGWVKNSAFLGAFAPWLLLALLSMQQSTIDAFATDAGRTVLTIGIIATAIAFLWMERMARLPIAPRAFTIGAKQP